MRQKRRPLKLSRETLRHLDANLGAVAGGTTTILIEPILKSLNSRCPSCELTCARTCTIDPASACLPDNCTLGCPVP